MIFIYLYLNNKSDTKIFFRNDQVLLNTVQKRPTNYGKIMNLHIHYIVITQKNIYMYKYMCLQKF